MSIAADPEGWTGRIVGAESPLPTPAGFVLPVEAKPKATVRHALLP